MFHKQEIVEVVDASGLTCPDPIIALQNTLRKLEKGAVVHLISTDRGSCYDIPTWTKINKHTLINQKEEDEKYIFWVRKNN